MRVGFREWQLLFLIVLLAGCAASGAPGRYGDEDTPLPSGWIAPPGETPRPADNSGVTIGTSADGRYVVDELGMSLYTFDNDPQGASKCTGGCAQSWPPLAGERPLTQLQGLGGDLTIIERDDGMPQVAYNDRPLYYFAGDNAPGDRRGAGRGGVWHLAIP